MSRPTVPLPDHGIIIDRSGKYRYVYKVTRTYRNERGQPTCDKLSIGRMSDDGRLVPNSRYYEFYSNPELVSSLPDLEIFHFKSVGASYLMHQVFSELGVSGILRDVFGAKRSTMLLTIATYMACHGNVIEYIDDWCDENYLGNKVSPQQASLLFSSITPDEKMKFFRSWVSLNCNSGYLAYDVTSFSCCYGKEILDAEWGYNRDSDKLPQLNMGCYLSHENWLPVFYVTYPGSIIDKSHMSCMMAYNDDLNIQDVAFVMDRGLCSAANLKWLHSKNIGYVIGVEKHHLAMQSAIDQIREGIVTFNNRVEDGVYAKSIRSRFYGVSSVLHIYYNNELAENQRTVLFRLVESKGEKLNQLKQLTPKEARSHRQFYDIKYNNDGTFIHNLNYDKVNEEAKNSGYFCVLSNIEESSSEILKIYRRKNRLEKGFADIKNYIDMKRMRTHNDNSTGGKLFCAFIALIAVSQILERLLIINESGGHRRLSKEKLVTELDKIKAIERGKGRRLMNPLTKHQRELLNSFGISETELQSFVTNPNF